MTERDISKQVEEAYAVMRGASIANQTGQQPPHWDDLSDAERQAFVDVCKITIMLLGESHD